MLISTFNVALPVMVTIRETSLVEHPNYRNESFMWKIFNSTLFRSEAVFKKEIVV